MPGAEALQRAEELHQEFPVVDCHGDIAMDVLRRQQAGEAAPLADDYAARLRQGGVRIEFMTVGGDQPLSMDGVGSPALRALELIDAVLNEADRSPDLQVIRTQADLDLTIARRSVGLVLHLEGLAPARGRPELVRTFHRLGVRSTQLTWNMRNEVADGVGEAVPAGLSTVGREITSELDRMGYVIDVSHLAPHGFWDVVELADGPIVASHANAMTIWPHPRNLEDDQIWAIASSGGFVGVCFFPAFIGEESSLDALLDHVDHLVGLVGADHVGVGPDYVDFARDLMLADLTWGGGGIDYGDDLEFGAGLDRVETLPVFTAGLLERGYSETDVAKIIGGNAVRLLREVLPTS
ncbi:MAG: dipeptidase [Gaiellales bacterium]